WHGGCSILTGGLTRRGPEHDAWSPLWVVLEVVGPASATLPIHRVTCTAPCLSWSAVVYTSLLKLTRLGRSQLHSCNRRWRLTPSFSRPWLYSPTSQQILEAPLPTQRVP